MDHSQATTPATGEQPPSAEQPPSGEQLPAGTPGFDDANGTGAPGFGARGRMRRRARFLRKARELAYRDLGGLVYSLHRFGQRNDALVLAKLETIARIDSELRGLESALTEHQPVTVLREAGVAACPRCAAIHGSDDRFCPNCGLAMDPRAERPVAGAAAPATAQPPTPPAAVRAPGDPAVASRPPASTPLAQPPAAPALAAQPSSAQVPAIQPSPQATAASSTGSPPPASASPATGSPGAGSPTTPAQPQTGRSKTPPPTSRTKPTPAKAPEPGGAKPGERPGGGTSVDESTEIIRPPIESS
jgi:hypothetical protein